MLASSRRLALFVCACLGLPACGGTETPASTRPPVVLVVIDTLRADHLGAYGYERPTSPNLDALGREGLVFERTFAQSTWTKPTTATILTGVFPSEHGVVHVSSTLSDSFQTMAEVLQARGYATGGFVANGFVSNQNYGYQQGFETFEGRDLKTGEFAYARADTVVSRALEWIQTTRQESPDTPPFLYVHVVDPHLPYDPPSPWRERFDRGYAGQVTGDFGGPDQPGTFADLTADDLEHLIDLYDGEIAFTDAELQRLFEGLREAEVFEDALVFVVADHGEEFGDHGGMQHNPGMFQEVVHVPLLVKPPRGYPSPRGYRHAGNAMQVDLLPTVYEVLGEAAPEDIRGVSLFARARGETQATDELAYGEVDKQGILRVMAVEGPIKYVRQLSPRPKEMIFDLDTDPAERNDLAGEQAGLVQRLSSRMDRYSELAARNAGFALCVVNDTEETLELQVRIGTEGGPPATFQAVSLEDVRAPEDTGRDALGGQIEGQLGTRPLVVTRVHLRTIPGDRDGLVFSPPEGSDRLLVDIRRAGAHIPLERIRIGGDGDPPGAQPLLLERGLPGLLAADPSTGPVAGAGYRVYLWQRQGLQAEERELDPTAVEELKQLGYFGDDR